MLQLAKDFGLEAFGTASKGKHGLVRELGGIPIDYKGDDFVARVREHTGGQGVDAVFDPIGGTHLSRSWAAVRKPHGILVGYGVSEALTGTGARRKALLATATRLVLFKILPGKRRAAFYRISQAPHSSYPMIREDLITLLEKLRAGTIRPIVGMRFALADAANAHKLMERSGTTGKIVLDHAMTSS
jgi:NADPH:quinone reductase-like Zn-dependent oxidoreductase